MTYKNIKFEDSAVMRSLEKLAVKKGLIEPEVMKKEARAQAAPYAPSENLGQNILKLCSGLRERGLGKYATEVENKFMALKTAESIEYSNLLNDAHSEGSHKMKDMEGDATIETLEDRQEKIQEIINKTPKGKFAVRDALNLVKITLGQELPADVSTISEYDLDLWRRKGAMGQLNLIMTHLSKAEGIISNKMNTTTLKSTFNHHYLKVQDAINGMQEETLGVKAIDGVIHHLDSIKEGVKFFNWKDLNPTSWLRHLGDVTDMATGNWDSTLRDQLLDLLDLGVKCAETARSNLRGDNDAVIKRRLTDRKNQAKTPADGEPGTLAPAAGEPGTLAPAAKTTEFVVDTKVRANQDLVKRYRTQVAADLDMSGKDKAEADKWLSEMGDKFEAQLVAYNANPKSQREAAIPAALKNVGVLEGRLSKFYTNWLA